MFAYQRLDKIYETVRNAAYTPAEKLAKQFGVTARTVRSDVAKINGVLSEHGARIEMKREAGYHLVATDVEAFQAWQAASQRAHREEPALSSADDRIRFLLGILLEGVDYTSYAELADRVYVGENTMQNYIRQIKEILAGYDLALMVKAGTGAKVLGREDAKRRCYMDRVIVRNMQSYVKGFTREETRLFPDLDLDRLDAIVREHLASSKIVTNDYDYKNLLVHAALMIERIRQGCEVELDERVSISPRIELFIDSACADLERDFGVRIGQAERNYLYLHILSNTSLKGPDISAQLFQNDVDEMLDLVFRNYGFDLRDDAELKRNLLDHLNATFRGKNLNVKKRNPLLNTIRTNFPLAFEIALASATKVFDTEPYTLSEDEVGYVALHLGAAIERKSPGGREPLRVMLVCGSGNSIAQMLKSRIDTFFGDKVQVVDTVSYRDFQALGVGDLADVAFVVTTVPLEGCPVPNVLVDFSLTSQDTEAVSRLINAVAANKSSKVGMFFDSSLFMHARAAMTKGEVLQQLGRMLMDAGAVDGSFLPSVLEREDLSDTNMGPVFAIPHSMNPIGMKTKVAVALLDEPVAWNAGAPEVQIVFLLAVRPGDRANIEHLYDLLLEITNDKRLQQGILGATTFGAFIDELNGERG